MTLFHDFCRFATAQVTSGDIDPMYPVLRRFYEVEKVPTEQALWRTLLYVTWYHVGSAQKVWTKHPWPAELREGDVLGLKTGVERRGFRGNVHALRFVRGVLDRAPLGLERWVGSLGEGEFAWMAARAELQAVPFGGVWASYKWADLLKNVHGFPLVANDIGVGGKGETAGPIPGMVRLTGKTWQECAGDVRLQRGLFKRCVDAGVPFGGLDQLETSLCDFNSLCKGSYYVGADIDMNMEHLGDRSGSLWGARSVFPDRYRGELNGWDGVRKELRGVYRDKGEVLV